MNLYLDDERTPYEGWLLSKTAWKAIEQLTIRNDIDIVSLDHDLGPVEAGTGYDVLCFIEECAFHNKGYVPPEIRIHTANPSARVKMQLGADKINKIRIERLNNV